VTYNETDYKGKCKGKVVPMLNTCTYLGTTPKAIKVKGKFIPGLN